MPQPRERLPLIKKMIAAIQYEKGQKDEFPDLHTEVIALSRTILKREWDRVKEPIPAPVTVSKASQGTPEGGTERCSRAVSPSEGESADTLQGVVEADGFASLISHRGNVHGHQLEAHLLGARLQVLEHPLAVGLFIVRRAPVHLSPCVPEHVGHDLRQLVSRGGEGLGRPQPGLQPAREGLPTPSARAPARRPPDERSWPPGWRFCACGH